MMKGKAHLLSVKSRFCCQSVAYFTLSKLINIKSREADAVYIYGPKFVNSLVPHANSCTSVLLLLNFKVQLFISRSTYARSLTRHIATSLLLFSLTFSLFLPQFGCERKGSLLQKAHRANTCGVASSLTQFTPFPLLSAPCHFPQ